MIGFLRKLFGAKVASKSEDSKSAEHALLVNFKGPFKNLDRILELEENLMEVVSDLGVGEVDGNEVALDGSEVTFYIYGPDADALLATVEPILRRKKWIKKVSLTRRYGPAEDPAARVVVTTIG